MNQKMENDPDEAYHLFMKYKTICVFEEKEYWNGRCKIHFAPIERMKWIIFWRNRGLWATLKTLLLASITKDDYLGFSFFDGYSQNVRRFLTFHIFIVLLYFGLVCCFFTQFVSHSFGDLRVKWFMIKNMFSIKRHIFHIVCLCVRVVSV